AEIERRMAAALDAAEPEARERAWARLVAAVNELLAGVRSHEAGAAARLRAFARENADLGRPRDLAITDFRFEQRGEGVLRDRAGRIYLVFAPPPKAAPAPPPLDEIVPGPTRRLVEWAVYGLCGGAALAAMWFSFFVPV
ncbi:MAG TPA: hypothetical protein VHS78_03440, partial [Candidatus Elarobacter sp.]|nr:hypothetical protein [Candidatus Elarobacter sp.]